MRDNLREDCVDVDDQVTQWGGSVVARTSKANVVAQHRQGPLTGAQKVVASVVVHDRHRRQQMVWYKRYFPLIPEGHHRLANITYSNEERHMLATPDLNEICLRRTYDARDEVSMFKVQSEKSTYQVELPSCADP